MESDDGIISDRTRRYIMVLSRTRDLDPELAHALRVRTAVGIDQATATRFITALEQLPER